jgi:hypothetical protein
MQILGCAAERALLNGKEYFDVIRITRFAHPQFYCATTEPLFVGQVER